MVQLTPSALRPACRSMRRSVSSIRKTPENPSPNGTTAELKMLLDLSIRSRRMIGLRLERQTTARDPAGRSSHGMLGRPTAAELVAGAEGEAGRVCSLAESMGPFRVCRRPPAGTGAFGAFADHSNHINATSASVGVVESRVRCGQFVVGFTKRSVIPTDAARGRCRFGPHEGNASRW